jgi:demethylmenaquinone methyltransferase/2-methoxy-6-polyprenyl-1,4-benzoquinol methylase
MLKVGTHKLASRGAAERIAAHAADGHNLPYASRCFDGAFSGFCVRNLHNLPRALVELRRVIKPGGTIVILEFFRPASQRWSRLFFDRFYNARVLPLLGWAVTGDRAAYQYLPASIARFLSREEFEQALRMAGFSDVRGEDLFPGAVASMVVGR